MDKTITRTKAIEELRKKCKETPCNECNMFRECNVGMCFPDMSNLELEQAYNLMLKEKVNIVDFIEATNGYDVTVRLDNINAKCFEKLMDNSKTSKLKKNFNDSNSDKTNPNYYKSECSLECIEAMLIAFGSDKVYDFCICNAFKYMWSYKNKNGFEDVKKARWYVDKAKELIPEYLEWQNIDEVLTKIESEVLA